MTFEIYIPKELTFQDYVAVCQCARTLADGYDRKDKARLRASLAPNITVDYTLVNPSWGPKQYTADAFVDDWLGPVHLGKAILATQHLLGTPYFHSATAEEIVVEWSQIAGHGRRVKGEDFTSPHCKIEETSDGRSYMLQKLVKVEGEWRISLIRPEVLYSTGNWLKVTRAEEED